MKTVCIIIGLISLYNAAIFLGQPAGMHHTLEKIAPIAVHNKQDIR